MSIPETNKRLCNYIVNFVKITALHQRDMEKSNERICKTSILQYTMPKK